MLTLCGFSASNYYNKAKLALMEKGLPFEESLRWPDQTDGKVRSAIFHLSERQLSGDEPFPGDEMFTVGALFLRVDVGG